MCIYLIQKFRDICIKDDFKKSYIEELSEILKNGLDINCLSENRSFLFYSLFQSAYLDIPSYLLSKGIDINLDQEVFSSNIYIESALHDFEFYDRSNQITKFYPIHITMFLISNGIDINILNNENETPLDITIKIGHILGEKLIRGLGGKTAKELLKLTFEDDNKDFNNLNKEFFYACIRKNKAKIDNLISNGVNLNSFYKLKGVNYGFLRACLSELKEDNFELAKYLIDSGLDVNLDKSIFTYILAKEISDRDYNFYVLKEKEYFSNETKRNKSFNDISLIGTQFLLDNKVDINILDYRGRSPLDIAIEYKHLPAMELLKSLGAKTSEEL